MGGVIQRVAMVSMHTSPTERPGTRDAGGMNVSILGVAAELAIRGIEVDLVTRATGAPSATPLLPGVTLHELPAGPREVVEKNTLRELADEFGESLAQRARQVPYDIIHAHYWLSGIAALPVALETDAAFVQSFHTLAVMKDAAMSESSRVGDAPAEPLIRLRSEGFLAAQANALVAASSAEATALIDDVGAPADRVWIIPPGVDLDLFAPRPSASHTVIRRQLGLEDTRPLVVVAGRVQPLKGQELAVRALGEFRVLRGWNPVLVVAGEVTPGDEGFAQQLRDLAEQLAVAADVRFVGALARDSLADLLAAATVTLVPSYSETFGLVALESAAAGTPVLGSRAGGLSESISEGVSGLLLGTREPRYWATELAIMIEDDERRQRFELTARAWAERFTWGSAATSLLGVYAGAVRPKGDRMPPAV